MGRFHCNRGVKPGGICVYVVQREPTPGGPGSGLCRGRKRFICQLPLWSCIYCWHCVYPDRRSSHSLPIFTIWPGLVLIQTDAPAQIRAADCSSGTTGCTTR
jgi:hypothetical protein